MKWTIVRYEEIGSTNEEALGLIRRGRARGGEVLVARAQTAGRGRHGRVWQSGVGGLWLTAVLPAREPLPGHGLAAGAALCRAVARFGVEPRLKWPNDVELAGRKLAGILVEHVAGTALVAVGIGVNVANEIADEAALRRPAIGLAAVMGRPLEPEALLGPLLEELDGVDEAWATGGWPAVMREVRRWDGSSGRRVRAADGAWAGTARGLDDDGALLVCDGADVLRRVSAGEVEFEDDGKEREDGG